ncbi:MAG: acyltransferase [Muribaculaceae bacterium]|nr:acyltransferase [Muribaculaceae bacterium]
MDIMRYVMTIAVITVHFNYLTGYDLPYILGHHAVGGFFAIAGYLIYPNYIKKGSFMKYIAHRARRILPSYFAVVLFCAIGFACISSLGAGEYFLSSGFWKYLCANLTFLNWLHPVLPGVFDTPQFVTDTVNGALWTMKVDWLLCFFMPVFIWITVTRKWCTPQQGAVLFILFSIAYSFAMSYLVRISGGNGLYAMLERQVFGQAYFFFFGMLVYFMRDFFTRHTPEMLVTGISIYLVSGAFGPALYMLFNPAGMTMILLSLSLMKPTVSWLHHRNNIAYEMYLSHFPVIQLCVYTGVCSNGPWVAGAVVLTATVTVAWLIHHLALRINSSYRAIH